MNYLSLLYKNRKLEKENFQLRAENEELQRKLNVKILVLKHRDKYIEQLEEDRSLLKKLFDLSQKLP